MKERLCRLDAAEPRANGPGVKPEPTPAVAWRQQSAKTGITVDDLFDEARLSARLAGSVAAKNVLLSQLYAAPSVSQSELLGALRRARSIVEPFVTDTSELLRVALSSGQRILLEGQLGALRDPDHGTYPGSSPRLSHDSAARAGDAQLRIPGGLAVAVDYGVPFR